MTNENVKNPVAISGLRSLASDYISCIRSCGDPESLSVAEAFENMPIASQDIFLVGQLWLADKLDPGIDFLVHKSQVTEKIREKRSEPEWNNGLLLMYIQASSGYTNRTHADSLVDSLSVDSAPREKGKEKVIQNRLAKELGGRTEIQVPAGRIDVLTDTHIIEVKEYKNWKSAIGQVHSYSVSYPGRKKAIHLFGELPKNLQAIVETCKFLNIELTTE